VCVWFGNKQFGLVSASLVVTYIYSRQIRYLVLQSKDTDKAQANMCEAWAKEKLSTPEFPMTSSPHDLLSTIIKRITEKPVLVRLAANNSNTYYPSPSFVFCNWREISAPVCPRTRTKFTSNPPINFFLGADTQPVYVHQLYGGLRNQMQHQKRERRVSFSIG
jgi:hypothetical protein